MRERLPLILLAFSLPAVGIVVWARRAPDAYRAVAGDGPLHLLAQGYVAVIATVWGLGAASLVAMWLIDRARIKPHQPPGHHRDGDYALPAAWRRELERAGAWTLSLRFNQPGLGLVADADGALGSGFDVPTGQDASDDDAIADWFARRLDLDPARIRVTAIDPGRWDPFGRRVSWRDVNG